MDNPTTFSGLIGLVFDQIWSAIFGDPQHFSQNKATEAPCYKGSEFSDAHIVNGPRTEKIQGVHWDLKQRSQKFTAWVHVLVSKGCWESSIHQSKEQNLCWSKKEVYDVYIYKYTRPNTIRSQLHCKHSHFWHPFPLPMSYLLVFRQEHFELKLFFSWSVFVAIHRHKDNAGKNEAWRIGCLSKGLKAACKRQDCGCGSHRVLSRIQHQT